MNWKFWERKPTSEVTIGDIQARLRGFILDSQINNAHEIAVILGASVSSEEVLEKEEEESEKRVERISYLVPLIFAQAHVLAEGAVAFQQEMLEEATSEVEIPSEVWTESRKLMEQVAISALMGGISQFVDMRLLQVPKIRTRRNGF